MLTSSDVASMMASQNQAFMGQQNFANQIGVAAPNLGLSAFGSPRDPMTPRIPGISSGPAPWSYADSGMTALGYGGGSKFAAGAMSFGGAAASVGMGFLPAFNPVSGFQAARAAGMGMMGTAAMTALPLAAGMAATMPMQWMVGGAQQQSMVNSVLGQNFGFNNIGSRTGSGFNRDDAKAISENIRNLGAIPELMTSFDELTRMIPKLKQSGMMTTVRSAGEFNRQFKEAISTIRDVSKMIGSTMEEAAEFFAHGRRMGFLGKKDQLQNTLNLQYTSGNTGLSMGQSMSLQSIGADMAGQTGGRRAHGARAILNMTNQIAQAHRGGKFREDLLLDMTGMEGEEAYGAAAQRAMGAMYKLGQTPIGQLAMLGAIKFDGNRAVGVDEDVASRIRSGEMGINELKRRAHGLNKEQKASFKARQGTLMSSLAENVGLGGMGRLITGAAGGIAGDEGVNLLVQRYGLNEQEADMMIGAQGVEDNKGERAAMGRLKMREARLSDNSPSAILRRVKTKMGNSLSHAWEQSGGSMQTSIAKAYDKFLDDMLGRHILEMTKETSRAFAQALSGGQSSELEAIFKAASGFDKEMGLGGQMRTTGDLAKKMGLKGGLIGREHSSGMAFLRSLGSTTTTGKSQERQLFDLASDWGTSDLSAVRKHAASLDKLSLSSGASGDAWRRALRSAASDDDIRRMDSGKKREFMGKTLDEMFLYAGADSSDFMENMGLRDSSGKLRTQEQVAALYDEQLSIGGSKGRIQGIKDKKSIALMAAKLSASTGGKAGRDEVLAMLNAQLGKDMRVNWGELAGVGQEFDEKAIKTAKEDALKSLSGLTSSESATALSADSSVRTFGKLFGSGKISGGAIQSALSGSPEEAAKALSKLLGSSVGVGSVDAIRKLWEDMDKQGFDGSAFEKSLSKLSGAQGAESFRILRERAKEQGKGLVGNVESNVRAGMSTKTAQLLEGFGQSLNDLGSSNADNAMDRVDAMRGKFGALSRGFLDMSDEERELVMSKGGASVRSALGRSLSTYKGLRGLSGRMSLDDVAKKLRIGKDSDEYGVLSGAFNKLEGSAMMTDDFKKDLAQRLGSMGIAGDVANEKDTMSHEDKLLQSLSELNLTMARVGTVLAKEKGQDALPFQQTIAKINEKTAGGNYQTADGSVESH